MGLVEKAKEVLDKQQEAITDIKELLEEASRRGTVIKFSLPSEEVFTVTPEKEVFIPRRILPPKKLSLENLVKLPFPTHPVWRRILKISGSTPKIEVYSP